MSEKKFGDRTFIIVPILATPGVILQGRILKLLGPAIAEMGAAFRGTQQTASPEEKADGMAAAGRALMSVMANADPVELASIMRELVSTTRIIRPSGERSQVDMDGDFSGEYSSDLYPFVAWVAREQFAPFFSGLSGLGISPKTQVR